MNRLELRAVLKQWDQQGKYVFSKHELAKLSPATSKKH